MNCKFTIHHSPFTIYNSNLTAHHLPFNLCCGRTEGSRLAMSPDRATLGSLLMSFGNWFRNHPKFLESAYTHTHTLLAKLHPLIKRIGYERVNRWFVPPEKLSKEIFFDCRMCGQCILHSAGMTCPMTCPKNIRNGPCGGVRQNGNCEVIPDMQCIWVAAFERSQKMPKFGNEILHLQPPVNHLLKGSSAWVNMLIGEDVKTPPGWIEIGGLEIGDSKQSSISNR